MPEGILGAPRSLVALPFKPVDIDGQTRAWRLREKGETDGRANLPPADGANTSAAEQQVTLWIEAERTRLAGDLAAHLRAQNDAIAQLDTAMDIAELRKDAGHAVSQLQQTHVAWKGEIPRLLRAAREAKAEYDGFRVSNGLLRPARLSGHRGVALSWLALCVVIESVLNGAFFAEGSDAGLIGGVAVALSVSVVNVVLLGFLLGFGPARWAHHRSWALRAVAILLLVAGGCLLVVVNAFVGHYRDAYERMGDAVQLPVVWAHLAANPFDLARLQSWLLFMLGLGFAGIGFFKGYHLDDPYPGYGPVARRWRDAEREYLTNRNLRLEEATAVRDAATQQVGRAIESLRGAAQQREQIIGQRARMIADFAAHEAHLREAANALLAVYRDANRHVRTAAVPALFGTTFDFPDSVLERSGFRALRSVEAPRHDANALVAELDRQREDILAAYRAVYDDAPAEI